MSSFWPDNDDLAKLDDADYLKSLKGLMVLVDRAMGDEGIDAATRDRVVSRVLHGTPTPDDTPEPDWAEPRPEDLDVIEALAEGPLREPACLPSPPMNAGGW